MNRRDAALALLALWASPGSGLAQQAGKVWRIGVLSQSDRPATGYFTRAFGRGMRELGYIEGRNLQIDLRVADGKIERLPALAAELVALKPDVLVSFANAGPLALQKATATIPIVMTSATDPVANGLVKSLAQPGGNITGFTTLNADLSPKRLELLREIVPRISTVAVLLHPASPANRAILESLQAAAQGYGMKILPLMTQTLAEIEDAFGLMAAQNAHALIVPSDPLFSQHGVRLGALSVKYRLPSMAADRRYVEAGCLASYGSSLADMYQRAAEYVDKIFKGARPGDLPVERPTKFELVINLKTARALGLAIPQTLLQRADEVVQ